MRGDLPTERKLARKWAGKISRSKMLSEYQIAFEKASGLPIRFDPVGEVGEGERRSGGGLGGALGENPFCSLLAQSEAGCRMCQEVDRKVRSGGAEEARTEMCLAGLVDTAVPVRVRGELVGFLRTGQVALQKPAAGAFTPVARMLVEWGLRTDLRRLEEAWFHSKVLEPAQYQAFVELLRVFARHLELAAAELGPEESAPEGSPVVSRVEAYLEEHPHEDVSLQDMAKLLNLSVFYFCKVFKKATGKTFTQYLAEVRVAKAKNLLMNPHVRISEVAFEAGFQSITHFNRLFRRVTGQSPTAYRLAQRGLDAGI
jgi:AraC-like DNA-binding protein